jgi:hypothetical protein
MAAAIAAAVFFMPLFKNNTRLWEYRNGVSHKDMSHHSNRHRNYLLFDTA